MKPFNLMKNPNRRLIKYIGKSRRKAYWKLPHLCWYIFFMMVSLICFGGSYILQCIKQNGNLWVASLLQSIGVGILIGIVIFLLGNIRNHVVEQIDRKVEQYSNLYQILQKVYNSMPDKALARLNANKYDYEECAYQTLSAAQEYIATIKKLDYALFFEFVRNTDINIDEIIKRLEEIFDNINSKERVEASDAYLIKQDIICTIQDASEWFEIQLEEAEIQKKQIRQYPF